MSSVTGLHGAVRVQYTKRVQLNYSSLHLIRKNALIIPAHFGLYDSHLSGAAGNNSVHKGDYIRDA